MITIIKFNKKLLVQLLLCIFFSIQLNAQTISRNTPKWWFGASGAVNKNYYRGNTQVLNSSVTTPKTFHKGESIRPYVSLLTEYRPNKYLGFMLNAAFDNRGGKFDSKIGACDCLTNLSTNLSYITLEPSIRIAPFGSSLYFYTGPTIGINISKGLVFEQQFQSDLRGDWGNINKKVIAAQLGIGFDIPLSGKSRETQMTLSPFASFQTDLFQSPRTIESWTIYTVRAGVALKLGTNKKTATPLQAKIILIPTIQVEKDVQFYVRAPKVVPLQRQVKETFPIRNAVFFDMGSTEISSRYNLLNKEEANVFNENQLQNAQPLNINNGRSERQLYVYHHILNILGDRMRLHPQSTIILTGSSDQNPTEGKFMAEKIKSYLVYMYGIQGNRIQTDGRDKPMIPSEQPGAIDELDLLHEGDRRVDIESNSPELLMQIGGHNSARLKPVEIFSTQQDPLDSHVIFTVDNASELLKEWNLEIKDEMGVTQTYGPYFSNQAHLAGNIILNGKSQGNYSITMLGTTNEGKKVKKSSSVSLTQINKPAEIGLRFSILFDFDKSKSIASYEKFLQNVVTPLIQDNNTVIIHGYTDIIGGVKYNLNLSRERANGVEQILKRSLGLQNKKGIQFETYGFGEDTTMSPFENDSPEERFYNRTVIIDIITNK
jgi:outer membrane protein OmpA-like peptidoglycan-associated protein